MSNVHIVDEHQFLPAQSHIPVSIIYLLLNGVGSRPGFLCQFDNSSIIRKILYAMVLYFDTVPKARGFEMFPASFRNKPVIVYNIFVRMKKNVLLKVLTFKIKPK